jgi:hypothetical protein
MNQKTPFFILSASLLAALFALLLGACPLEDSDDAGEEPEPPTITFTGGKGELELRALDAEPRFFSLSTGKEITAQEDIESTAWDICFFATRMLLTNSGKTAGDYFSGGKGGVWHTNQTDFEEVTGKDDAVTGPDPLDGRDYGEYNQDVLRYAVSMAVASLRYERSMNVMTFIGYDNDSVPNAGMSAANPFGGLFRYNKKAFYSNYYEDANGNLLLVMPPNFYVTNQVYIIRHGDGEHHSKFQVTKFERNYENGLFNFNSDTYAVRWENLE